MGSGPQTRFGGWSQSPDFVESDTSASYHGLLVSRNPTIVWGAIAGVIAIYVVLWSWLLYDTWNATAPLDPSGVQTTVTPLVGGGLGLLFAVALGVEPRTRGVTGFWARLKAVFGTKGLLTVGAIVYAGSAVAGVVVWAHAGANTPDLVTALVLVAVGYAVTAMTSLAQGNP